MVTDILGMTAQEKLVQEEESLRAYSRLNLNPYITATVNYSQWDKRININYDFSRTFEDNLSYATEGCSIIPALGDTIALNKVKGKEMLLALDFNNPKERVIFWWDFNLDLEGNIKKYITTIYPLLDYDWGELDELIEMILEEFANDKKAFLTRAKLVINEESPW